MTTEKTTIQISKSTLEALNLAKIKYCGKIGKMITIEEFLKIKILGEKK